MAKSKKPEQAIFYQNFMRFSFDNQNENSEDLEVRQYIKQAVKEALVGEETVQVQLNVI